MSSDSAIRVCVGDFNQPPPGWLSMHGRDDADVPFHALARLTPLMVAQPTCRLPEAGEKSSFRDRMRPDRQILLVRVTMKNEKR